MGSNLTKTNLATGQSDDVSITYRDSPRSRLVTSRYQNVQIYITIKNLQIDRHYLYCIPSVILIFFKYSGCNFIKLNRSWSFGAKMDPILMQINRIICWLKKTLVNSSIPLSGNVDCTNYIDFSPRSGYFTIAVFTDHCHKTYPHI